MKMKYYLRGMGIGIFVTTLIFLIAIAFSNPAQMEEADSGNDMANQTIKEEKLQEEQDVLDAKESDETLKTDQTEVEDETSAEYVKPDPVTLEEESKDSTEASKEADRGNVEFTISGGEGSSTVGNRLQQEGLVDSGNRFNRFLEDNDYDNIIQPGTYAIPKGSTYEEIAKIITSRP